MKAARFAFLVATILLTTLHALAAPAIGAAPKGDATAISSRIIKYNFPACKNVTQAVRRPDSSIRARCDGVEYLVFTIFNPQEGKMIEIAMNCTAAKSLLGVSC